MKLNEITSESKFQARIYHPEDRIFDEGSIGAHKALESLKDAASSSQNISIKWDGTPSLIAGNLNGNFVMTDKVGMKKRQFPQTSGEIFNMIFNRLPDQAGRSDYSTSLAGLFQIMKTVFPKNFTGLIQFDVMWLQKPKIIDKNYVIQPNKVLYKIPIYSELGKQISSSRFGIVIHSYFATPNDSEPRAINDFSNIGFIPNSELVILNSKVNFSVQPSRKIINFIGFSQDRITTYSKEIDSFLNKQSLMKNKITDLPSRMKQFLAVQARNGTESESKNLSIDFITWFKDLSMTDSKKTNSLNYIRNNSRGFDYIWWSVSGIIRCKNQILNILNKNPQNIQANIGDNLSHEGYVIDAISGKIKLVNRPLFMNKNTIGSFDQKSNSSLPISKE
jgi:hypothetical protein